MTGFYFSTPEHKAFYETNRKITENGQDSAALVYVLGISEACRTHFKDLYDVNKRCIKPAALHKPWQTGTSKKITRLAFNLFTWNTAEGDDAEKYTPKELFSGLDANEKKAAAQALIYFA